MALSPPASGWPLPAVSVRAWILLALALIAIPVLALEVPVLASCFALLLALVVPGCALVEALFPRDRDLSLLERTTLGLVLSLAISPAISLALRLVSALSPITLVLTISSISLLMVFFAIYRRVKMPSNAMTDRQTSLSPSSSLQLLAIVVFTVIVRLVSLLVIDRNMMTSDPEPMIVHDVASGSIPASYASIWHYLGLAPYSYPILFHSLLAELQIIAEFSLSSLFLFNAYVAALPILVTFILVNRLYGKSAAIASAFILATAPIFIFETLPGTFKARAMDYALIAAEIYCITRIAGRGRWRFLLLAIVLFSASSLTYRVSIPVNIFILASVLGAALLVRTHPFFRLLGVTVSVLGLAGMAIAYLSYTGSLADLTTIPSSLAKEGPLLLLGGIGGALAILRRDRTGVFLCIIGVGSLAIGLANWKAADVVPILLSPLAGLGLLKLAGLHMPIIKLDLRKIMVVAVLVGLLTSSFGLAYYPAKWYVPQDPKIFDELARIKDFVEQRLQKGAIALGSGYTVTAISGSRSGIVIIGTDQRAFIEAYSLNLLVARDFDPGLVWAWRTYAGLIYDNSGQFYDSILSLQGNALRQFLVTYFAQYFVAERNAQTLQWIEANRSTFNNILSTDHYTVLEVIPTRPLIQLLAYVNEKTPIGAKIVEPYYMSPFLGQLRQDQVHTDLGDILNFNYPIEYERLHREIPNAKIDELRSRIYALEDAYADPQRLISLAEQTNARYVVVDPYHATLKEKLVRMGQRLLFSEGGVTLLQVTSPPKEYTPILTVEVVNSTAAPVQNVSISIRTSDGRSVAESPTASSGSTSFTLPIGTYLIAAGAVGIKLAETVTLRDDLRVVLFIPPETSRKHVVEARDSLDRKPIAGASVAVRYLNGTLVHMSLTDETGQASVLLRERTYNITLNYLGSSVSQVVGLESDYKIDFTLEYLAIAVNAVSNRHLPIGPVQLMANGTLLASSRPGDFNTLVFGVPRGNYNITGVSGDTGKSLAVAVYYATFIPIIFY